jgi:hypothetical protein
METARTNGRCSNRKTRNSIKIQTSLYELMETVIDMVNPDKNRLVKEVTLKLLAKDRPRIRVTGH